MSGPIDESRHDVIHVGEVGAQTYNPKPYRELTPKERRTVEELKEIERWQTRLYAPDARPRMNRRKKKT